MEDRQALVERIERFTEVPLLVLALLMVPLLMGPYLWDLTGEEEEVYFWLDGIIWAAFAVDLLVKLIISPHRIAYVRSHWLETALVAVPFFRPLRLIRLLIYGSRAFTGVRALLRADTLLVYAIALVVVGAMIVMSLEDNTPDSSISSFPDALWWATVTVTTVGYGDFVPVSPGGRMVAMILMLGGITLFSALTANLASLLVRPEPRDEAAGDALNQLLEEVQGLRQEVVRLRGDGS